ncbi:class I SAM-dependent methyltransferase [Flavobacteriaceae bacterium]|nr:class I SAM-dependent methyltransferase [Flavobacteriaceae bacterium]
MRKILRKIKLGINSLFYYPSKILSETEYDKYWESKRGSNMSDMNSFQLKRAEIIGNLIENNITLLDIGTGDGNILKEISKKININITASDFSIKSITHLKEEGFNVIELDVNDSSSLEKIDVYDFISALEVLEHIQNPEKVLFQLLDKSKKGVFISFPNTGYVFYRLRFLFGRFPIQWRLHPGEHLRFWTYKDLKWWLKKLSISKYKIHTYEGIPLFNKLYPSLFAEAFLIEIKK